MAATAAAVMAGAPLAAYAAAVVAATAVTTTRPAQAALIPSVAATPDQLTAVNVVVGWLEATGLAVAGLLAGVLILVAGAQRRAGGARTRAWCGRHLLAAAGASNALLEIATRTLLQRSVPPQLIGRIFGLLEGLTMAGYALGALLVPMLVYLGGSRLALLGVAALLPLAAAVGGRALFGLDAKAPVPVVEIALLRSLPLFAELPAPASVRVIGRRPRSRQRREPSRRPGGSPRQAGSFCRSARRAPEEQPLLPWPRVRQAGS
jgi:hypothetical protein